MNRKRYAVCGVSSRAIGMYIGPMLRDFGHCAELVAMLDIDPLRFQVCKDQVPEAKDVPEYPAADFDRMMAETRPDAVLVVCMDRFHVEYILRSLAYDVDVISEKPMTTNTADALRVLEAEKRSKGKVICTFNYRYTPPSVKIREMILEGKIGRVTHVDLNWYIDIHHGSSYFHRWNRMRGNSGSLSIHKSSHHFDLRPEDAPRHRAPRPRLSRDALERQGDLPPPERGKDLSCLGHDGRPAAGTDLQAVTGNHSLGHARRVP